MKKQLLSATALVAAGAIASMGAAHAQTVKLGVGGYMNQWQGVTFDRDSTAGVGPAGTIPVSSFRQFSENEVHFKGMGKLDNGIEIVTQVDLEAGGSPGQIIDEQYLIVRGNFGQVTLGMEDGAYFNMTLGYAGSWATQVGANLNLDRGNWIERPGAGGGSNTTAFGPANFQTWLRMEADDSNQISYYSPRFAGFQLGASYIPSEVQQTQATNGASVLGTSEAVNNLTRKANAYNEGWGLGANYTGNFDNVGVGVAAGYLHMSPPTGLHDAARGYTVAASVTVGPFKVAGAYLRHLDWDIATTGTAAVGATPTHSMKGWAYDLGARYTFGANAVSVAYQHGEFEGSLADTDEDEDTGFSVAYARTLAPGVKVTGTMLYSDQEIEPTEVTATQLRSFDGWAFVTSIGVNF